MGIYQRAGSIVVPTEYSPVSCAAGERNQKASSPPGRDELKRNPALHSHLVLGQLPRNVATVSQGQDYQRDTGAALHAEQGLLGDFLVAE